MSSKIPNSGTWNELSDRANAVYFPSEHKYKTRQFQTEFSPYSYFNLKKKKAMVNTNLKQNCW